MDHGPVALVETRFKMEIAGLGALTVNVAVAVSVPIVSPPMVVVTESLVLM